VQQESEDGMGPEEEEGEERESRSGILPLTSPSTPTPIQRQSFGLVEEPDRMHDHTQSEFWYPVRYSTTASQDVQPAPLSLALFASSSESS